MVDFVSLTCPSCGGKLEIRANVKRFACGYCGTEHIVERSGGTVTLEPVISFEIKKDAIEIIEKKENAFSNS